jgi:hypothetical protein
VGKACRGQAVFDHRFVQHHDALADFKAPFQGSCSSPSPFPAFRRSLPRISLAVQRPRTAVDPRFPRFILTMSHLSWTGSLTSTELYELLSQQAA